MVICSKAKDCKSSIPCIHSKNHKEIPEKVLARKDKPDDPDVFLINYESCRESGCHFAEDKVLCK